MSRIRNPIQKSIKVEDLTDRSVIIVKIGSAFDTDKQLKALAGELVKRNLPNVIIMRLASLADFHTLSEEQMNRLGWFRKDKEDDGKELP